MEAALSVQILDSDLGGSRLVQAYLGGDSEAAAFYGSNGAPPLALGDRVATLDGLWTPDRRAATAELLGAASAAADPRLARFVDERGFVVTTGQQAGFLGGPLYTISKAMGAVAHASRLASLTGRPVLPVFWIASEDHDWAEAESALVLRNDGTPVSLRAQPLEDPAGRSVFEVPLAAPSAVLAALAEIWPPGALADEAAALIRDAYAPGNTLAEGFEHLMQALVSRFGLLFVQAHDPTLKQLSKPVLRAAIQDASAHSRAVARRGEALETAGFHQQVTAAPGATNLLVGTSEGRQRLHLHGEGFRIGGEGEAIPERSLLELLADEPARITPDALLRPVVEASLFPSLAYIAGPGEIAYYAQNGPLYDAMAVVRPRVLKRPSVQIVEPKVAKALSRIGMDAADIGGPLHELRTRLARERIPPAVAEIIERTREVYEQGIEALRSEAANIDPTMAGPVEQAGRRGAQSLERAEKKIMQAVKRRSSEAMAHLDRARAGLHPNGTPQERSVSIFHFLGRYGVDVLDRMFTVVTNQINDRETDAG